MAGLRAPEDMFISDMIGKIYVDIKTGENIKIDVFYNAIKNLELNPRCPESVIRKFNNARNLHLYSFYNYEFCMNARNELIVALEMALKERASIEKRKLESYQGFHKLIDLALKEKWIIEKDLPSIRENIKDIDSFKEFVYFFKYIRNELSHGSTMIYPPIIDEFVYIQRIINLLYH